MSGRYFEALDRKWATYWHVTNRPDYWQEYLPSRADPSAARVFQGAFRQMLPSAEPFFWDSSICDVVEHAAQSLSSWTIEPTALPTPSGFSWFERPLRLSLPSDDMLSLNLNLGMYGFFWGTVAGAVLLVGIVMFEDGSMGPGAQLLLPWGSDVLDHDFGAQSEHEYIGQRARDQAAYIAAGMLFLEQRLAVRSRQEVPRSVARRIQRDKPDADVGVQVVTLRRPTSAGSEATESGTDWHCQWMVRGHWRNQPYGPLHKSRRPKWITPYVKGPEGRPFKPPSERVFAVVR